MNQIKTLNIPKISRIENIQFDNVINILDNKGQKYIIDSINWEEEYPYHPLSSFTIAHDGVYIYIDFFVRCNYLKAENFENNSPVSQDSCVEFFVAPKCDNHYWNFEFNCIGAINASHRTDRKNPTRLNDDELAQVLRYASCGDKPFKERNGLFTWNLLVAIPLSLMGIKYNNAPINMTGNFYKCASKSSQPHYLSWNPIHTDKPNFHRQEFFGNIILK